ncbi:sugar phosphate isomerase/epimerase family protein [Herbiconiux sp. SYSU D00978]|uniref:sugar phosphate isomerase/epimerase family protein n=1 Tax=Herbiconiux sp. SYSU D00978 TaxID=2812562 RepID=UPI001A97C371|nr:sugar phosphate isomerase/epimerase family protein [Herbiconiux sp. SYSU D00978]
MAYTAETWPIAAALLQFPGTLRDGSSVQDAPVESWVETLSEVGRVGFDNVDLTDSWLRIGDLTPARHAEFASALRHLSLTVPAVSITRRSVADPVAGTENLAYAHRTIDAAAELGAGVLSIGFHQPLTAAQREQLWFWNAAGAADDVDDPTAWARAVARISELGRHAADAGLLVSIELYEDTFFGTADSAVRFIEDVDLPNVGINPDIGNLLRLHRPVERWQDMLAKTLPYANYWQVKNYTRDEDPLTGAIVTTPAPLELGVVDYRTAIRDAVALGFDGVITCEHYGGDGLGISARNMRYLRTLLPSEPALGAVQSADVLKEHVG